jgi:TolA-binding protein
VTAQRPGQALARRTAAAESDLGQHRAIDSTSPTSVPEPFIAPLPSRPSSPSAASSTAVSDEVRQLDQAMARLRRDHDAAAALAALDSYLDRYPHGALKQEAQLARIDSLLMLGRNQQALRELEVVRLGRGLRSTELLVVRAELRAMHDCRQAELDFTAALGRGPDAPLLERILYGRGVCRIKMQDAAGARQDVRAYLEHFPGGVRAEWARRWLLGVQAHGESAR